MQEIMLKKENVNSELKIVPRKKSLERYPESRIQINTTNSI
jgi:hypothetical protein